MGFSDNLRKLDSQSSVSREFRVYTVHGAILSVVTVLAISYLLFSEVRYNFQTVVQERVHVNATSPTGVDVEFDITLPHVPCSLLNIDANDPTGQTQSLHLDRRHHIWKHRIRMIQGGDGSGKTNATTLEYIGDRQKLEQGSTLHRDAAIQQGLETLKQNDHRTLEDLAAVVAEEAQGTTTKDGKAEGENKGEGDDEDKDELALSCGSCYGAGDEGECCNTCDDVKRAYNRKGWHLGDTTSIVQCQQEASTATQEGEDEGCNVHGIVALDSGGGSFHLAPGRSKEQQQQQNGAGDLSGSVFELLLRTFEQFNVTHTVHKLRFGDEYPGHVHQLDGETRVIADGYGMYQYYFKIVPTLYRFHNGTSIQTNQYSVTEHLRHVNPGGGRGLPGVFFFYEISPLHVEMVEGYRKGYIAFFTSVCAIVGGVVTTMGLLDQILYSRNQAGTKGQSGLLR